MKSQLLSGLRKMLPTIQFVESTTFYWSPQTSSIYMNSSTLNNEDGQWALLHEASHALLDHQSYHTDVVLLMLEVEAWQSAELLSKNMDIAITEEHIQDCLNTYRDWLYARSTCPTCALNSLQIDETTYLCLNCSTRWSVSRSRFCRPYRMQDRHKKTPSELNQTVFQ
jgi:hypothetical protein